MCITLDVCPFIKCLCSYSAVHLQHTYPLARIGVRVSCLCPSFTDTQIVEDIRKAYRVDDSVEKEAAQQLEGRFNMMGMMQ